MAIDPSLTCSGWALFSIENGNLAAVGKIRSLPAAVPLAERLRDLQEKISATFDQVELSRDDVLICEAPTTMKDPRAAFKVEQVRGIFEALARGRNLSVPGRINPRSVHFEVMGLRGKQLQRATIKDMASRVVCSLFANPLTDMGFDISTDSLKKHQDIVDAILIGSLGLTWIKAAQVAGGSLESYFEDRKVLKRRPTFRDLGKRA